MRVTRFDATERSAGCVGSGLNRKRTSLFGLRTRAARSARGEQAKWPRLACRAACPEPARQVPLPFRAVRLAVLATGATPLPSLAEQHSGIFALADLDAKTAGTISTFLSPVLSLSILLMICRIPLSWYPNLNARRLPWVIAVAPTEPVLAPTRKLIPPVGGVDISPIIWTAVLSFVNEILLGPQGILNLLQRKLEL